MKRKLNRMLALLALAGSASFAQTPVTSIGTLRGHLTIVALKTVESADPLPPTGYPYQQYPLIIRNAQTGAEVGRTEANATGNFRLALPVGSYLLDVEGRGLGKVRAQPKPFQVEPNATVRVDLTIDPGIR